MGLLNILYRDDDIVLVDKPDGLLVHRTRISRDHTFLVQLLRDQVGQFVYPVHRLDRPTSGVMLFALSSEMASRLGGAFASREVHKEYLALVRGRVDETGTVARPILNEGGAEQEARTDYQRLAAVELPVQVGPHPTTRYSLVAAQPQTGRMHQIRRHLRSISHPIIGDTEYGDGRHNRFFRDTFNIRRLMLHARRLTFPHPVTGEELVVEAPLPPEFMLVAMHWGWTVADLDSHTSKGVADAVDE